MTRCAIPNCKSHLRKTCRYFSLPRNEERRKEWIKFSQRDPVSFDPAKQYRFCEIHFDEKQYELNRQDNWKKLKPNAIPTINLPSTIELEQTSQETRKGNKRGVQNSNTACHDQSEHDLPEKKSRSTRVRRSITCCASTSRTRNGHSDLSHDNIANVIVEEIFIDLENGNEKLPKEEPAEDTSASEIGELRNENEKLRKESEQLRKENEQLRTTVVKMQKLLARRRFTYLNVKALLQNKNKDVSVIFKNKKS